MIITKSQVQSHDLESDHDRVIGIIARDHAHGIDLVIGVTDVN